MKRYFGFTLSEILITLGIVGVVAGLTLPNVIKHYQKQTVLTQLKKAYSELGQAIQFVEVEHGSKETWDFSLTGEQFFKTYLDKYIKINQTNSDKLRQNVKYFKMNGDEYTKTGYIWSNSYIVTTNSGYTLFFETWSDTRNQYIFIDVNGPLKGPNTFGKDLHSFLLWKDNGLKPLDVNNSGNLVTDRETLMNNCKSYGSFCTAILLMDNWQFSKDYPW